MRRLIDASVAALSALLSPLLKRRGREPLIYRLLREEERRFKREWRRPLRITDKFKPGWRDGEAWRLARMCKNADSCYPRIRFLLYKHGRAVVEWLNSLSHRRVDVDTAVRVAVKYGIRSRQVEDCVKLGLCEV